MSHSPQISICAYVHNAELYLSHFLDSALQQRFQDYEIVLLEDHSTDRSLEIANKYEKAFSDKVYVYQTDIHVGVGKARRLAFQKAKGEYIYWCDADGLIHPNALGKLCDAAIQNNAEVVSAYAIQINQENGEILHITKYAEKKDTQVSQESAIISETKIWLHFIKRELIERTECLLDDNLLDDEYIAVLRSYADGIQYINFPIYYWFNRGLININAINTTEYRDSIDTNQYILEHSNPQYRKAEQHYVAKNICNNLDEKWAFYDIFVNEIRAQVDWIYDNEQIRRNPNLLAKLHRADCLADIEFPNTIYVDGFGMPPTQERLMELREKVFHDGCQIVILSEENCDINENEYVKRAYDRGDLNFVSRYFALKNILKNGGVFIHTNIRILNYFGYLKYQNAFFALIDKNTYSDWIFGAPAGNEAIAAILQTYSDAWDKKGEYISLSQRIAIVLIGKYGIPMDGAARLFGKVVSVLPPDLSVVDTRFGDEKKKCAFEHDFSAYAGSDEYVTIPRSSLQQMLQPVPSGNPADAAKAREYDILVNSHVYKYVRIWKRIGDGPYGPKLKKILNKLRAIKTKLFRK